MAGSRVQDRVHEPEAPPPILGRWRNVYLLLLFELGLLVVLFRLLRWWAS